jgi:TP901 family phage tail tape measure protein
MPQYVVETAFKVNDKLTKPVEKLTPLMRKFGRQSERSFKDASKSASRFSDIVKGILVAGVVQRGTALLGEGLRTAARDFATLDDAAMGATVRFSDMSVEGENLWKNLNIVKTVAREMGRTTEQTATAAAIGLDFFARAGFKSATAFGLIKPAIDLATASGEDFALVTDWTTDLLGSFGLNIGASADKIKNYVRLTDVLVAAANSANITISSMFETFKQAGPVGFEYGLSMEETAAAAAVLASNGIKGEMAATALKNILSRLSAPTYEVLQGFKRLNITQKDLLDIKGAGKPLIDVLSILDDRMAKLTRSQRLEAIKKIGGLRALAGLSILVRNRKEYERLHNIVLESIGTNEKYANVMRKSLGNQVKLLTSALSALGDRFYQVFESDIRRIFPKVIRFFQELNIEPFARAIRGVIALTYKFVSAVVSLTKTFSNFNAVVTANPVMMAAMSLMAGVKTTFGYRKEIADWFTGGKTTAGKVDINFNNVPAGTDIQPQGIMPGELTINREAMGVTP